MNQFLNVRIFIQQITHSILQFLALMFMLAFYNSSLGSMNLLQLSRDRFNLCEYLFVFFSIYGFFISSSLLPPSFEVDTPPPCAVAPLLLLLLDFFIPNPNSRGLIIIIVSRMSAFQLSPTNFPPDPCADFLVAERFVGDFLGLSLSFFWNIPIEM